MKIFRTVLFAVPVIGWLLRSAWHGDATEKAFFVVNLLMAWALAFLQFGYPALIVPALAVAGFYIAFMVYFTAGDLRAVRVDE
jgi:hypothetical protein